MFQAATFSANVFAPRVFIGRGASVATVTLETTWTFGGSLFVSQSLDYVVKDGQNNIIAYGTASTNGSGVLSIEINVRYSGQKVVVHVENVGASGDTTGKVHGTQVVQVP